MSALLPKTGIEKIHERHVKSRRAFILHEKLKDLLPNFKATVLDIGCGDGVVAMHLKKSKPNLEIQGIDTLVRPGTAIPVSQFDGQDIPFESESFDLCMFVDVLHHAKSPFILLKEAVRVARHGIIIKDHKVSGLFARQTLKFMDDTHNRRYGVSLPYNYWTEEEWNDAFEKLHLNVFRYERRLNLYPFWADWIFGRSLHFIGFFEKNKSTI
jgi:ubiquinone/menaquinone biosynthesis C-methylase UbiE